MKTLARDVRRILTSDQFQLIFPEAKLGSGKLSVDTQVEFSVGEHGFYKGFPILGRPQGQGADLLFSDDLIGSTLDCTDNHLKDVMISYKENFRSRAQPAGLKEILIQTRYHHFDPAGSFANEEPEQWIQLVFPMIATAAENEFEYRDPGEPLFNSLEAALKLKRNTSPRAWAALYQQSPMIEDGNIFKEEWLTYYQPDELPAFAERSVDFHIVDPSMGKEKGDFCSIGHFRYHQPSKCLYLVDLIHQRLTWPEILTTLKRIHRPKQKIFIEIDGHQEGLLQIGKEANLPLYGVRTHGRKKVIRAEEITPFFANGRMLLPRQHLLIEQIRQELLTFPNHIYDDIIDTLVYAIDCIEQNKVLPAVSPHFINAQPVNNQLLGRYDHYRRF